MTWINTVAAATLVLALTTGAHAQGTGQGGSTAGQSAPSAQGGATEGTGHGMHGQGMPMMQGRGGMTCPMMQRMAAMEDRLRRLEEKAGIPSPAAPAAPAQSPMR